MPNQFERMCSMSVMHSSSNKHGWSPKLYSRAVWQAEYALTHKKLEVSLDVNSATVTYRSCDYVLLAFLCYPSVETNSFGG